ncbi:MAG: Trk system potassium transporter TrkA [Paludibacteraceae bacterium]|nr:Trk system potassium transporter TrkA [Paludibacteraceae bacterium]
MRIIIAGAGSVGCHLAKLLSRENMEITLMDDDRERLGLLDTNYDLLTRVGSATSLHDLRDIGVAGVDLFIAVTPQESVNINACLIANRLGAKRTLARIDNYEYMLPENKAFFEELGLNHLIYPEVLAAKEITDSLHTNWMRYNQQLSGGDLELCVVKVRQNADMLNRKFMSGYFSHGKYRIVAIKRQNNTFIPRGDDQVEPSDLLFIVCKQKHRNLLLEQAGKNKHEIRNVIVYGGTRIAQKAIQSMPADMHIKWIEPDRDLCNRLAEKVTNAMIICGNASDMDFLREEGIEDADAFVALTDNAETNIFACLAAKQFGVRKTIAEVENLDYVPMAEGLDIGTVLNKKTITASYIYQMLLDQAVLNVLNITAADAQLVEFIAANGSAVTRHKVKDLHLPEDANIGALIRAGVGILVNGDTQIVKDDRVVVFCKSQVIQKMEKFFK